MEMACSSSIHSKNSKNRGQQHQVIKFVMCTSPLLIASSIPRSRLSHGWVKLESCTNKNHLCRDEPHDHTSETGTENSKVNETLHCVLSLCSMGVKWPLKAGSCKPIWPQNTQHGSQKITDFKYCLADKDSFIHSFIHLYTTCPIQGCEGTEPILNKWVEGSPEYGINLSQGTHIIHTRIHT